MNHGLILGRCDIVSTFSASASAIIQGASGVRTCLVQARDKTMLQQLYQHC